MDDSLRQALQANLGVGAGERIVAERSLSKGSLNETHWVQVADGHSLFIKSNPRAPAGLFRCEATGLAALHAAASLRIPKVFGIDENFLILEYIESAPNSTSSDERLGRGLATLHRATRATRFGFPDHNYLGLTYQSNCWHSSWIEFFREERLSFQLDLARRTRPIERSFIRRTEMLISRLDGYLAPDNDPPCLLHGDLWSGNYLVDKKGTPILIDPAVYYGSRETDLAMTRLFGGFGERFYEAYEETWPLQPGAAQRVEIYNLYHLLNHLNLFGMSYLASCREIVDRYV